MGQKKKGLWPFNCKELETARDKTGMLPKEAAQAIGKERNVKAGNVLKQYQRYEGGEISMVNLNDRRVVEQINAMCKVLHVTREVLLTEPQTHMATPQDALRMLNRSSQWAVLKDSVRRGEASTEKPKPFRRTPPLDVSVTQALVFLLQSPEEQRISLFLGRLEANLSEVAAKSGAGSLNLVWVQDLRGGDTWTTGQHWLNGVLGVLLTDLASEAELGTQLTEHIGDSTLFITLGPLAGLCLTREEWGGLKEFLTVQWPGLMKHLEQPARVRLLVPLLFCEPLGGIGLRRREFDNLYKELVKETKAAAKEVEKKAAEKAEKKVAEEVPKEAPKEEDRRSPCSGYGLVALNKLEWPSESEFLIWLQEDGLWNRPGRPGILGVQKPEPEVLTAISERYGALARKDAFKDLDQIFRWVVSDLAHHVW